MSAFRNVRIVLVNTSHPGNIGASARAMKNMGLTQLTLVQPAEFPSGVAVGRAASAVDILEGAEVVNSLQEAVADCGLVIGASARVRRLPWPMLSPWQCAAQVLEERRRHKVALVFGREDAGLNNEELQLCHFHVQIPTADAYPSLNLAAAVMVLCYELRKAELQAADSGRNPSWDQARATGDEVERFYEHLQRVMIALEFHDPENPRQLMQRLRRLFNRIRPDVMEINILRGILSKVEQRVEKGREPR